MPVGNPRGRSGRRLAVLSWLFVVLFWCGNHALPGAPIASKRPAAAVSVAGAATVTAPLPTGQDDLGAGVGSDIAATLTEVEALWAAGKAEAAREKLETAAALASDPAMLQARLARLFADEAEKLQAGRDAAAVPADEAATVIEKLRRARDLESGSLERWRAFMVFLAQRPESATELTVAGQELLGLHGTRLATAPAAPWVPVFERLRPQLQTRGLTLDEIEVAQLLARQPDAKAAATARARVEQLQIEIKARFKDYIGRVELALARGEVDEAEQLVGRLRRIEPGSRAVVELEARCRRVREIQGLLVRVTQALAAGQLDLAQRSVQQILKLDPGNPNATAYQKTIEELRRQPRPGGGGGGPGGVAVVDLRQLRKRELVKNLAAAEAEDDRARARQVLRDLVMLGVEDARQRERLRELDRELAEARALVETRWVEAEKLLADRQYKELHRFMNRNPALPEAPGRLVQYWEMRLLVDARLERKDEFELVREENALLLRNPKSFTVVLLRLERAMDRRAVDEVEKLLAEALKLDAKSPELVWPQRWLLLKRHGWKIVTPPLIVLFWFLAKAIMWFFDWWERFYWHRARWLCRYLPRLALRSLERRFGIVKDIDQRVVMFELLTEAAAKINDRAKVERYAEVLRSMAPTNAVAVEHLGAIWLQQPAQMAKHLDLVIRYVAAHLGERVVVERLVKHVVAGKDLRPELIPIIKRHLVTVPDDKSAVLFLAGVYSGLRPGDIGAEGLDLLEKAWRIAGDEPLFVVLWRGVVAAGQFDRAAALLLENKKPGGELEAQMWLEGYDRELDGEASNLAAHVQRADRAELAGLLDQVLRYRYLYDRHVHQLLLPLENLGIEDDTALRVKAQKARDHLRGVQVKSVDFHQRIEAMLVPPDTPVADMPVADMPVTDVPVTDMPVTDMPVTDMPVADMPGVDLPVTNEVWSDPPAPGVPHLEVGSSEVPTTEVPGVEPLAAEVEETGLGVDVPAADAPVASALFADLAGEEPGDGATTTADPPGLEPVVGGFSGEQVATEQYAGNMHGTEDGGSSPGDNTAYVDTPAPAVDRAGEPPAGGGGELFADLDAVDAADAAAENKQPDAVDTFFPGQADAGSAPAKSFADLLNELDPDDEPPVDHDKKR